MIPRNLFRFASLTSISVVLLFLLSAAFQTRAQSVNFQGLITTVAGGATFGSPCGTEFGYPSGTAVDAAGSLYTADTSNERICKVDTSGNFTIAVGGTTTPCIGATDSIGDGCTGTGAVLSAPSGLAIDTSGNLYIADSGNNRIRRVDAKTGIVTTVAGTGTSCTSPVPGCGDGGQAINATLNSPVGVAVDAAGNLYIAGEQEYRIRMVNTSGIITTVAGTGVSGFFGDGGPATSAKMGTLCGVSLDSAGNIYIADCDTNYRVRKVDGTGKITTVAGNGSYSSTGDGGLATSASLYPTSVAFDSLGEMIVGDFEGQSIRKVDASGTITTVAGNGTKGYTGDKGPALLAELHNPEGFSTDHAGNIYFADMMNHAVRKLQLYSAAFGRSNVGSTSTTYSLGFQFTSSVSVGSVAVLTLGAGGKDFQSVSGGTCAAGGFSSGNSCTVNVTFNPVAPGLRSGAVVLYDNNSPANALSTVFISGIGVGPMDTFIPAKSVTNIYPSSFELAPMSVAVDAGGNVFFDDEEGSIYEMPWNGSSYGTPVKISGSFSLSYSISGIAIDGAGNVFVADHSNQEIVEIPWTGSGYGAPASIPLTGFSGGINGLALDGSGNIYFSGSAVIEVPRTANGFGALITLPFSGLSSPAGIALDTAGNVYVSDKNNQQIVQLLATGTGYGAQVVFATGLHTGNGLAVDPAGDVYSDGGYLGVVEIPWNGVSFGAPVSVYPNLSLAISANGIALDSSGNIYEADAYTRLNKLDWADPPSLSFATTAIGSTSTDSPQIVLVSNIGNAPLNFTDIANNPGYPTDFPENISTSQLCVDTNYSPGASCNVSINFTPTSSGPLSENVVLTDNNLNPSGSVTQDIAVSGTASGAPAPVIKWSLATPITYGTALGSGDLAATATYSGDDISRDGTFAYYVGSVGGTTATASTVLPGGSSQLCVQWTPSSEYTGTYGSASLCLSIIVNAATPSINWMPASPILYPATLGSGQLNAVASSGSTNLDEYGNYIYYVGPVGGTVANSSTMLPVGSNQLCVQWTPSSSYSADYNSSSLCVYITVNAPTSISWTPATLTYPATLGSGQLNAAALSGSTNIGANGTFTYYVTSVGGTVATTSTVLPGGTNTLCVQWVPSSSFTSQYSSAWLCVYITVQAASTTIGWAPSTTTIVASTGPTAGQFDATAVVGSTNVTANGTMTYHLSTVGGTPISIGAPLTVGAVTICAVWAPSSGYSLDYSGSNACQVFSVINTQPTTTTLAANNNPLFLNNSVTFTATVTPTSGTIVPTGSVTFYAGSTAIGTGTLSASGTGASAIAKLTTTSLGTGSQAITASYPGDTNNQASATTALTEVVEDFSITSTGSSSSTVAPGLAAGFTFTVSPVSPATTFPAAITLTATGLPAGATATFSPTSIASGAGSTTVTLTVITPITTLSRNPSPAQGARWPLVAVALLLLPLAGKFRRAGRRLSRSLSLLLLAAAGLTAAAALNGCGGISTGYFGQAPSTSSITVTGTSGSLNHIANVSLTVE